MRHLLDRGINFLELLISYHLSLLTGRVIHRGMPAAVGMEPNNTCNLRCPECPAGLQSLTRPTGFMTPGLFRSALGQLSPCLSWITLYFQGEPYLHPRFFDLVAYARSQGIVVATSTNGHFFTEPNVVKTLESDLNQLIISLDGPDQESYESYRKGGDFDRVLAGIRLLVSERKRLRRRRPRIILQCLLLKTTERRLGEMKRLAKELGVDKLEFKTAQFADFEHGNPLMPDDPSLSRYHPTPCPSPNREGSTSAHQHIQTPPRPSATPPQTGRGISASACYQISNPLRNRCFRMWSSCVITWDGKVVPCCFDKDAAHVLGDLAQQSFAEIWNGVAAQQFRKTILTNRKSVEMCRNCTQTF